MYLTDVSFSYYKVLCFVIFFIFLNLSYDLFTISVIHILNELLCNLFVGQYNASHSISTTGRLQNVKL